MKNFKVSLLWMGACFVCLVLGFFSGMYSSEIANKCIQIETGAMKLSVVFKPDASELVRDIGAASLRYYAEVLTVCLSEPVNLEKINSTQVLANFVAGSCVANMLRPRGKEKKKNPDGVAPKGKHDI